MALNFYPFTALTGGGTGALDGKDGASLADGDGALVIIDNQVYIYHLDATSATAESSPDIISPDANAGNKRWVLAGFTGKNVVVGDQSCEDGTLSGGQWDSVVAKIYVSNKIAVSKLNFAASTTYAAAKVKGLIYADNGSDAPSTQKGVSAELTGVTAGWTNETSFSPNILLDPGWYWIGVVSDTSMTLWGSQSGYIKYYNGTSVADYNTPGDPFGTAIFFSSGLSVNILGTEQRSL